MRGAAKGALSGHRQNQGRGVRGPGGCQAVACQGAGEIVARPAVARSTGLRFRLFRFLFHVFFFSFFFWLFFGQTVRNRATFTLCSVAAFHFGSAANCNLPFTHLSPSSSFSSRSCSRSRSQATINQRVR